MDTYYWIVISEDNKAFPQYDFNTGKPNKWADIPFTNIKSVILQPFQRDLAEKVKKYPTPDTIISFPLLPQFKFNVNKKALVERIQSITIHNKLKCKSCGFESFPDKFIKRKEKEKVFFECPKCHAKDAFVCTHCGHKEFTYPKSKICPECGKEAFYNFNPITYQITREERHTKYKVYIDESVFLIDENGNFELIR